MVGTTKKSTETKLRAWFSRKVRQACDGGLRCRTVYLETVGSEISIPSLSNSPWILGAPHKGFVRLMVRIKSRTSRDTGGRPGLPCRIFHRQNTRNPLRCQATTVSGLTIINADRQSGQTLASQTQKSRSDTVSLRCLGEERRRTPSCYRKATFSTRSVVAVLNSVEKAMSNRSRRLCID